MKHLLLVLLVLLAPILGNAKVVDLTRYLASGAVAEDRFSAVPGSGRLSVSGPGARAVRVLLNGLPIEVDDSTIDVELRAQNDIRLDVSSDGAPFEVRVKQRAEVELNVVSRIHFNTNVRDFAAARAWYGMLGFETMSGFPDTNTVAMAEAIGVDTPTSYDGSQGGEPGGYLLHGELIGVNGFSGGLIDLIEFSIPRREHDPYPAVNRLGMARAIMYTSDIDADFEFLSARGVEFLSAPVSRTDESRFAIFRDPDGTFYELNQPAAPDEASEGAPAIYALGPLNVNVSDAERSRAWYEMLGFDVEQAVLERGDGALAKAYGFDSEVAREGFLMRHPGDASALEIVEWITPYDGSPPYSIPMNHIGIARMAFLTTDIEADVAALKAQGVEFVSDVTPCCSGSDSWGSIVAFYDPDGTIVELAEQPGMGEIMAIMSWFRRLFD